jgi:DNA polymerase (family 10)
MNELISSKLNDLALLRKVQGANSFRAAAYSKAADVISRLDFELSSSDQIDSIEGLGEKTILAAGIILKSGSHPELDASKGLLDPVKELTRVPGIGPKRAFDFIAQGINSIEQLKQAIFAGRVTQKKLLDAIAFAEMDAGGRIPLHFILPSAERTRDTLFGLQFVQKAELTGSVRRKLPTVKDVDILVCSEHPDLVTAEFLKLGTPIESGDHKASIFSWFEYGTFGPKQYRLDLMIVPCKCWGAALCHFTGSKEHNIQLRKMAKERGINVSQNGIVGPNGEWLGGEEEADLYRVLGLVYYEPESRG